jgi:hypothetical protein
MSIPVPQLDNRTWDDLLADAKTFLAGRSESWTDLSPGDPGMVLVELFAHLTEQMLYWLNRAPEKAYIEYLRLVGLTMRPPTAAAVELELATDRPAAEPIPIPRGTRASIDQASGGADPPIFTSADPAVIAAGQLSVTVLAHHCDEIDGELLGSGTGAPNQSFLVARPPIIAPTTSGPGQLDLVIGVEARPEELSDRIPARDFGGKAFRLWQETDNFVNCSPEDTVFVADRLGGRITFAPAVSLPDAQGNERSVLMAAVPGQQREVRAWYRRGGGSAGNVPAGVITVLKDTVPGLRAVTNPRAATGGRPAETVEEALIRGPQELRGTERAVTATDYETIALRSSGAIVRAFAATQAATWKHAQPGAVELLLVPYVDSQELGGGPVTPDVLQAHETETARAQAQAAVDDRRPLGTTCSVSWASYKTVAVRSRVVVRRAENLAAVKQRVEARLYATISPLPAPQLGLAGWPFGEPLRASNVFDILLKEPGVRWADNPTMIVAQAPDANVLALARDEFQPNTWYAGSGDTLFRSLNNAASWEPVATFAAEQIHRIESHRELPGHVAATTATANGSALHVSLDTGQTWDAQALPKPTWTINDVAWSMQGTSPLLLLATDVGVYRLALTDEPSFLQVELGANAPTGGYWAVASAVDALGARNVAVAAEDAGGVWLSSDGAAPGSFRTTTTLSGQDIRVLAIQRDGPRAFLWAGAAAAGEDDPGKGTWRWELRGSDNPPEGWVAFQNNWNGGSCWGIAFADDTVYAASHHGGVLYLNLQDAALSWTKPDPNRSLPLRNPQGYEFQQVDAVAAAPGCILAGLASVTDEPGAVPGVYRSSNGATYVYAANKEFRDQVALPSNWLFVSGQHQIEVVSEGESPA